MTAKQRASMLAATFADKTGLDANHTVDLREMVEHELNEFVANVLGSADIHPWVLAEGQSIIEIAEKRRRMILDAMRDSAQGSPEWAINSIQVCELDHMISMIRVRWSS